MYINIHTHSYNQIDDSSWNLINLHCNYHHNNSLFNYSLGLHPWHININSFKDDLSLLKIHSNKSNVFAIGECGLDRICDTPYKLQQELFKEQILWANEIAKPLIIHSVRSHEDVLQMLRDNMNIMPVIFHGFNKNEVLAQRIINEGYYISLGKDIKKIEMEKIINSIPLNRLFLETDDSDLQIENIYKEFARIRNISLSQLILQIQKNLKTVFKI